MAHPFMRVRCVRRASQDIARQALVALVLALACTDEGPELDAAVVGKLL